MTRDLLKEGSLQSCLVVCVTQADLACQAAADVANALRLRGVAVDMECGRDLSSFAGYDAVVLGAPLCHGRWDRAVWRFLRCHREALEGRNVALFTSNSCDGTQSAYDRAWTGTIKMLTRLGWLVPVRIEVFAEPGVAAGSRCGTQPDVERWADNLVISMHLSDDDIPGSVL